MQKHILSLLILFSISFYCLGQTDTVAFKKLEVIVTDLNNDNLADTIILGSSLKDSLMFNNIPAFNKISISVTGFSKQIFIAKISWNTIVGYDTIFLAKNKNSVDSKKIFISKTKKQSVILLFGYLSGAGYRDEFSIINITNNKVQMVFDYLRKELDVAIPTTIKDLDKD